MVIAALAAAAVMIPLPPLQREKAKLIARKDLPKFMPMPTGGSVGAGGGILVDFSVEYRGDYMTIFSESISCINACLGKKHADHVECDFTCDRTCTAKHDTPIEPHVEFALGFDTWFDKTIRWLEGTKPEGLYPRRGKGSAYKVMKAINRVSTDFLTKNKPRIEQASLIPSAKHWNEHPCSSSPKRISFNGIEVWLKYRIYDAFETITQGETRYATIIYPNKDMGGGMTYNNCKCSGLSSYSVGRLGDLFLPSPAGDKKKEQTRPRTGTRPATDDEKEEQEKKPIIKTSGLFFGDSSGFRAATAMDMGNYGVNVSADSMNKVSVSLSNQMPGVDLLGLGAGSLLIPDNDDYQEIVTAEPLILTFEALTGLSASLNPKPFLQEKSGFSLCAEMDKKTPDGNVPYTAITPSDEKLIDIAGVVARSGFKGPWHQALTWIYTDAATYEQINERLSPGVSERQYLNALHDLSDRCLIDLSDRRFEKCLDPSLLNAGRGRPEAITWFCIELPADKLLKWAQDERPLAQNWAESAPEHLAAVTAGLGEREEEEIVIAAARMLEGLSLEAIEKLADAGSLVGVANLLTSKEDRAVDAALDLFEKAPTQFCWGFLSGLSEEVSSGNRDRAEKLLEKLNA
jgi:hypothetical protein